MTIDAPKPDIPPFDHQTYLREMTEKPGVYQMRDASGNLLYVGKAKNLKKRLSSYFRSRGLSTKTMSLVRRIASIDVTVTATETEALLLEHNLIKQYQPPFNILLRDDKSYPYIFLSAGEYPRLELHRGAKKAKGTYFGPYPNVSSVRETLNLLQQVFQVRQCDDTYFKNRKRPCLQYQIKRCTAPCTKEVSKADYDQQVEHTRLFLEGKNQQLQKMLQDKMQKASEALDFEQAALYRDQLQHLSRVTETQYIESGTDQLDVVALAIKAGVACVHVLFIRQGRMIGSRSYYPKLGIDRDKESLLLGFLGQFYLAASQRDFPRRIVVPEESSLLMELSQALSQQASKKVEVVGPTRGRVEKWLELAEQTAVTNVTQKVLAKANVEKRFKALQAELSAERLERIECFDISHSSGESTKASCVAFTREGPQKSHYRQFNIEGIKASDDYAAMEQALRRRFGGSQKDKNLPDLLLIDGGKGQVGIAKTVLTELAVENVLLIGVAKGADRRAGFEQLILVDENRTIQLPADSEALHLIQYVRDEAHRFAVKSHTQSRDKKRRRSILEDIPGVGAKRRRDLLHHFGSVKAVTEAPVRELIKVPGINQRLAEEIYAACRH